MAGRSSPPRQAPSTSSDAIFAPKHLDGGIDLIQRFDLLDVFRLHGSAGRSYIIQITLLY